MRRPWSALLLLAAASSLFCSPAAPPPRGPSDPDATAPPTFLAHRLPDAQDTLTFPPAPDGRRARAPMPDDFMGYRRDSDPAKVIEPELDPEGQFDVVGDRVRIGFNRAMQRPAPGANARKSDVDSIEAAPGTLRVSPEVPGTVRWLSPYMLELVAANPLTIGATYSIQLGDLKTASGDPLEAGWKATFVPRASIAGKVLSYVPMPGEHRPVALHPAEGTLVGRSPELSVLFDQPISIAVARQLVRLEDDQGRRVPLIFDHPKTRSFQGVQVDPRFVVLAKPAGPLPNGKDFKLVASESAPKDDSAPRTSSFSVASPLEHQAVACGDGRAEQCDFSDGRLRMSGREVHVIFNHRLRMSGKALQQRVAVMPRVRNLSVYESGWSDEGLLVLSGAFEPSTSYSVTISGLRDGFGGRLAKPVSFRVETAPVGASVSMPEGVLLLDEATSKSFRVSSRNVAEAAINLWPVPQGAGAEAIERAVGRVRAHEIPSEPPGLTIRVPIKAEHDKLIETPVNLLDKLSAGTSYLATVAIQTPAFGAAPIKFPSGSEASRPPVALITPGSPTSLAVHTRDMPGARLVHVSRLTSGEPVAGASVQILGDGQPPAVTTDATGVAVIPGDHEGVLWVRASDAELKLDLGDAGTAAKELFPELTQGADAASSDLRAMVITDRGIYRPGSTVLIKASLRRPDGDRLVAVPSAALRVRALGPTGDEALSELVTTGDVGSVATRFTVPGDAKLGRYQILVEQPDRPEPPLARGIVQVAEFEAPRFAVDVDAAASERSRVRATIRGRYLFGAPMDGASLQWTVRRAPAPLPAGRFTDQGFVFRPSSGDWYDDEPREETWSRAGQAALDKTGVFKLEQPISIEGAVGPQELVIEADVTDASNRHVAGRSAVTVHPASRYAGLRVPSRWVSTGDSLPVELGVVDTSGSPVVDVPVTALLERVSWHHARRRGAGGATRYEWTSTRSEAGRCSVKSASSPAACKLPLTRSGSYEITAVIDGRKGGSTSVWAWRDAGGDDADEGSAAFPSRGRTVEIITDKARYAPGETAHLLIHSPYPAATAILTVEQGGLTQHKALRITGPAASLDVPLTAAHAPHVHASVTLLPIGAKGDAIADYRVGAVRLPVSLGRARLDVAVRSGKPSYAPGEEAEITVAVKDGGAPEPNAEIALAVVDEGILRLTGFHPTDPAAALRPGRALDFRLIDSRRGLAELLARSHVAGDGGGETTTLTSTRKSFVETALWKPDLRTDASGLATVKFRLPDNLTQFRIMAVVLDDEGKGAATEGDFTVKKPVMVVPVVPRFASTGDSFEAAAMVHNNTDAPLALDVTLGDASRPVTVPASGRTRVGFPLTAGAAGDMVLHFAARSGGAPLDAVEARVPVSAPGIDEHPSLEGAFARHQEIALAVPASAVSTREDALHIQVGQHLWPELGERLGFLMDYPHGCVEQTTSSTLPLLAGRDIFPRIGFTRFSDSDLKAKIRAGLDRLNSMRTPSGGLAYWPGDSEPNVFGTAYAMRAVVLAERSGIAPPRGLLEGMQEYLEGEIQSSSMKPEVQAAIAQSLGELGKLPASLADALFDRMKEQTVFGAASLAIALRTLPGQDDRVEELLDRVERGFDERGNLVDHPSSEDFYYYGSPERTRAQAAIALLRLRPRSKVLPVLVNDLADTRASYTTQATAYSLLALAQQLAGRTGDGTEVRALLDGAPLAVSRELGAGSREYVIPLARLRGKKAVLRLESAGEAPVGFLVSARWRRPAGEVGSPEATTAALGPDVFRIFTDAKGAPVDLARVHAGDVLRVAMLVRMPQDIDHERFGYLAVTDHLPAGFEPVQTDLATVASVPDLDSSHPLASMLRWNRTTASHVELHDDRVNVYFDRVNDDFVAATYLVRASTPGTFVAAPASAELMYEPDSHGYTEAAKVVIQ